MDEKEFSWSSRLARYFLHGMAFSFLLLLLGLVWIIILAMLVAVGFIIGFIIGFVVLFFFIGGLNTLLTDSIWSVTTEADWKTLLIHGLGLFLISVIADLPGYFLIRMLPTLATMIGVFVVYSFIDGFIGKSVASLWAERPVYAVSEEVEAPSDSAAQESRTKEAEAELLYDELLTRFTGHWGTRLGTQLLDDEIKAYTRRGETFEEAVRRVYQRQQRDTAK